MANRKQWKCSTCGTPNAAHHLCCWKCGNEAASDPEATNEEPEYATKADLERIEKKIDGLGQAPAPAPSATSKKRGGGRLEGLVTVDDDDENEEDEEGEDENGDE